MRFAIGYQPAFHGLDPARLLDYARHGEECGFEGIYLPEHVALYPGARLGEMELPPTTPYLDPVDALAFVAAATSRLLLGTGVLLLPYHHPVPLAKRLATVDVLSGGRLRLLTVGVGALPGEAAAAGVDFTTRGRRADEALDVLRLLWTGGPVSFDGEFFAFEDVCAFPRPLADLPVHVGGSSLAAARRAGRRGDGYFAGGLLTPDERARQFAAARAAAVDAGRDPDALEYTRWGSVDMPGSTVEALAAQGVTRLVVSASSADPAEQRDQLSAFARRFGLG
ncbi:TIGR03619 family F420-dependent LLM class oxidoreductase [Actinophytocola sp.]|uniref:TIGR03619 family F420-dependent LLM class oxidoreductase n=1 Tax=Actinophytocola sp. TaxID=1872138 RepID=UPI00389A954D